MSDEFTVADTAFPSDSSTISPRPRPPGPPVIGSAMRSKLAASHNVVVKLVREAPLPSLVVAFLLGIVIGRRR